MWWRTTRRWLSDSDLGTVHRRDEPDDGRDGTVDEPVHRVRPRRSLTRPGLRNVGAVVTATDAYNDTLTYSLEGTDAAKFGIVSTSGQITTKAGEKYDREAKASYSVGAGGASRLAGRGW